MKILKVDPKKPDMEKLKEAAGVIKEGGIVIFPTETVYGLGADPFNKNAIRKIYKLKGRSFKKPLAVLVSNADQVRPLVKGISKTAKELMKKYWPGPMTLVFKRSRMMPSHLTAGGDTVGIRMPDHPITLKLIAACRMPLAATSANKSGSKDTRTAKEALKQLKKVDMVIDGGWARIGKASTVVDMTSPAPKILRQGTLKIDLK